MLENTERRDFRNYCRSEVTLRDIFDGHRRRIRRLRIDKPNLLYVTGLRSCHESVTYDVLAYLSGAKVLAKLMGPGGGEGKEHCHA